jgi:hypothetical protein
MCKSLSLSHWRRRCLFVGGGGGWMNKIGRVCS